MDEKNEEWNLLSIIYETAHDPGFWPLALEGLKAELVIDDVEHNDALPSLTPMHIHSNSQYTSEQITQVNRSNFDIRLNHASPTSTSNIDNLLVSDQEKELIVKLTPHFHTALELNRKFVDLSEAKNIANGILDKIPFGIIFVNSDGKILLENKAAADLITSGNTLRVKDGHICAMSSRHTQDLLTSIKETIENTQPDELNSLNVLSFKINGDTPPLSILVVPYQLHGNITTNSLCSALFVTTPDADYKICERTLSTLFTLTKAESRLAKHIASGMSTDVFSKRYHVSKHTIRKQLKMIYNKTNTHSQCELMKLILTSPTVFSNTISETKNATRRASDHNRANDKLATTRSIILRDSRKLHYGLYGKKDGEPVILCHGSYGCHTERYPDDMLTHSLGIRLVVPDRPGYGDSDIKKNREGLDWCDDLLQLMEKLDISKVSLLGVGVGGYFAIAAAHKLSQHLNKVVLVNSVAPFESIKEFSGMVPHDKIFFGLARHAPSLFKRFAELTLAGLIKNIDWYFKSLEIYGGEMDRGTISNDELVTHLKDMVCTASHNGVTGFIQDMIMVTKKWEFPLSAIETPISIYHGEKQVAIPLSMGQRLASTLPKNKSHFIRNEGNYLLLNHWKTIMQEFI